jgi:hypothetical protein
MQDQPSLNELRPVRFPERALRPAERRCFERKQRLFARRWRRDQIANTILCLVILGMIVVMGVREGFQWWGPWLILGACGLSFLLTSLKSWSAFQSRLRPVRQTLEHGTCHELRLQPSAIDEYAPSKAGGGTFAFAIGRSTLVLQDWAFFDEDRLLNTDFTLIVYDELEQHELLRLLPRGEKLAPRVRDDDYLDLPLANHLAYDYSGSLDELHRHFAVHIES